MKLSKAEFDRIVRKAIRRIPIEIRQHLDNILISVRRRPSKDLLTELGMPADELLLGIFEGTALPERSVTEPPLYPNTILQFQEPLQEICDNLAELEEQIEITVAHEIAHYLGLSDDELAKLGYD